METEMTEDDVMELSTKQIMKDLQEILVVTRNENIKSRTAKLWLLYVQYISIAKEYILSEKTCNGSLHLHMVQKMTNLFAASGHINYSKCSRLNAQEILAFSNEKPWKTYTNSLLMENKQYDVLAATDLVCGQTR